MPGGMMGGAAPIADLEGKDIWLPWAPFWAPWPAAWVWAWPAWPFVKSKSLERSDETAHLMALEGELAQLIGLEKDKTIKQLTSFKGKVPVWSGFDPIPGLPGSLYKWVDVPPAIGSVYPPEKKATAPKKVEDAVKMWGVWPYGAWWAGGWYWPK